MKPSDPTLARRTRHAIAAALLAVVAQSAVAAEEAPSAPPPGFPPGIDWEPVFSATWGSFGFGNSYYANPRDGEPSGDLSDNWFEGSLKGGIKGSYKMSDSSEIYGSLTAVGERTYGAGAQIVGDDASSFQIEDAYLGWKSGDIDLTLGRTRYRLGHGMLLYDGASEGGSRGGYWTNARQAFGFAAIGRFTPGNNRLEAFYLERDEIPGSRTDASLWGLNYEYSIGEDTTLGATYMQWSADPSRAPARDGLDVYNLRAFTAPFPSMKALSFELEYAQEDNGDLRDSTAYNALVAYQFESSWKPKLSYRYAYFEGDDPNTAKDESFDGLYTGFYDWGTWWQGEIAGEYFLSNSNLISHQLRLHVKPNDAISMGLMLFDFQLDNAASAGVTSDDVATELDWYMDWAYNDNFTFSFIAAVAEPGDAVEQSSGRSDTFIYGMIFVAYSY
ncbi:hypothetical protein HNQ60_004051 [Povalibacter uvarum]|uniref:Alginate export domain-containing protein n=1 Tax=Povalibacter uvarum TaxID=732238 RepID=A0A841HPB8_9GAMM|nr:alginate export family protein [Povalibacter uvarum]MBB6095161.1 hypothetical protein [Povalibacter uvarum]